MVEDLRALLLRFGLTRLADVGNRAAGATVIRGSLVRDAIADKPVKIKVIQRWVDGAERRATAIAASLRERIRASVKTVIADAEKEDKQVTIGELARRISRTVHATEPIGGRVDGRVYVFSAARAELIARTEMAQTENTGRIAGYEATGVDRIQWLAYRDGKSGERHHERMHGVQIALGEMFVMPSGRRLRYPGDPLGHISETANCRCTVRPVRARG